MRFHSSTLSSSSLESGNTPALFTITSIRPQVSRPNLTNAWTSSRVVTSKARYSALPPSFRSASASVFNRPVRLAPRTTAAPFRLSTRAVASPMPLLAPVMRTTLSLMCDISFPFFICENNPSLPKFPLLRPNSLNSDCAAYVSVGPTCTLNPPSAMTIDPTMKLALSEARNAATSAISSGCAARPIGAFFPCCARKSRPFGMK